MALRAVIEHPKFAHLKDILKEPRAHCLGYLEAIWHFTGRFTPRGNIGKYSDSQIEAWVEWHREPGELISALKISGWIDCDETHRLIIHDWHTHADATTKLALKRSNSDFVAPVSAHSRDSVATPSRLPEPVPEPVPEPEPAPVPVSQKASEENSLKPSQIMNADWFEFKEVAQRAGMDGGSVDYDQAWMTWRTLDLDQRAAALKGILDRVMANATDDPALKSLVQNYLRQKKWERNIRHPVIESRAASMSARDAAKEEAIQRKERNMELYGNKKSLRVI
jgi:hypothetical protein